MGEIRQGADTRLDEALDRAALQDPRAFFRDQLRLLKDSDPAAFEEARRHYEEVLLGRVAAEDSDPVLEWFEYGKLLTELGGKGGRLVMVDRGGRATTFSPPLVMDQLVFHLPEDPHAPALALSMPRALSPAQEATASLLLEGRVQLTEAAPPAS
jgi:hypothetical protein